MPLDKITVSSFGLRGLRYFAAVAEELHFGRAAARLNVAQPAVSQQIRALETRLGVRLMERRGRLVTLTAAGEILLAHARRLLGDAEAAIRATRQAAHGLGGHLTIGFVHALATVALPPILARFRQDCPAVTWTLTELTVAAQKEAILEAQIDVGIVRPPIRHPAVRHHVLCSEPFVAALPTTHRLAARRRIALPALAGDGFVMFPETAGDAGVHGTLMAWFARHRISPRIVQEATTLHTSLGLVRAGLGVALVPRSAGFARLDGVAFVPVTESPTVATALAWRQDDPSRLVRSFREAAATVPLAL